MKLISTALALLLISGAAFAANEYPDPSDVTVGKPEDISQQQFATIRAFCVKLSPGSYYHRETCEKVEFDAVRKLRGDKKK
jgi:hypothetical protein